MRWPGATGLTSYLSGCLLSHASDALLDIANLLEGAYKPCPGSVSVPGSNALFVPPFSVFLWAGLVSKSARVIRPVLLHSSNLLPSG